ncbi:MAG TPA: VCBS repeat-containing protein, partial [Chitinophagaceae bacterium]|nr:VCBS repeat-containing protein [Chitinophagaceae bacterium]
GARGQGGRLLVQQSTGHFYATDTSVFGIDAACEDVDAVFFDSNGDGHPDLYVVSGGNEETGSSVTLLDRLYLNDGKGHFLKTTNSLPPLFENKSCAAAADVDHDGDQDIFVGTLADARAYGIPQTSFLLLNDGKGKFSVAGNNIIPLSGIGIVTTGMFTDLDGDSWPDLVIAGEWMPVLVFMNRKGRFELSEVKNSSGWWQALFSDDVNGDGYTDLLAGNYGWNNKFHSGKNGPVKMYVSDFDRNGHTDQLLSYTFNGEEYPFLAKDEVERALPLLRKHYLLYAEYADVPMKDVFYGWIDTIKPKLAERMGSAVLYGDGKGGFEIADLPAGLQLSPIFSFQKVAEPGKNLYVTGGNFFDVIPYEGRYDASALALFEVSKNNTVTVIPQPGLSQAKGQVRDLKWVRTANNQKLLVAGVNNDSLKIYKLAK